MQRFYLSELPAQSGTVSLTEDEAAHAVRVLRVRPGDPVTVLNGQGLRLLTRVIHADRRRVDLEVQQREETPRAPFELCLFQAVTKPKSMEWIVQKATELGVCAIQPVVTARVVPLGAEAEGARKVDKWRRIAVEALKQCGQPWLPRIEAPAHLTDLLGNAAGSFLASLQPGARPLRDWLAEDAERLQSGRGWSVALWIGPEGDFTPEETRAILAAGARPITLGPGVLRSETAALCGLTLLDYELNLLRGADHTRRHIKAGVPGVEGTQS